VRPCNRVQWSRLYEAKYFKACETKLEELVWGATRLPFGIADEAVAGIDSVLASLALQDEGGNAEWRRTLKKASCGPPQAVFASMLLEKARQTVESGSDEEQASMLPYAGAIVFVAERMVKRHWPKYRSELLGNLQVWMLMAMIESALRHHASSRGLIPAVREDLSWNVELQAPPDAGQCICDTFVTPALRSSANSSTQATTKTAVALGASSLEVLEAGFLSAAPTLHGPQQKRGTLDPQAQVDALSWALRHAKDDEDARNNTNTFHQLEWVCAAIGGSALLSRRHRFVYIKTPKTGSSTVMYRWLHPALCPPRLGIPSVVNRMGQLVSGDCPDDPPWDPWPKSEEERREIWRTFFVFVVVRNVWSRAASAYHYMEHTFEKNAKKGDW